MKKFLFIMFLFCGIVSAQQGRYTIFKDGISTTTTDYIPIFTDTNKVQNSLLYKSGNNLRSDYYRFLVDSVYSASTGYIIVEGMKVSGGNAYIYGDLTMYGNMTLGGFVEWAAMDTTDADSGDVPLFNGTTWAPGTISGGSADTTHYVVFNKVTGLQDSLDAVQADVAGKEGTLTNEAGLYAALSDVTNFLQTGDALAGDDITDNSVDSSEIDESTLLLQNLGGAVTDAQVPNDITLDQFPASGTNPTTDAAGEIAVDTDDSFIEFYSGASRVLNALQSQTVVIIRPDSVQGESDAVPVWHFPAEAFPHGVTLVDIIVQTSATCTDALNFEEWSNNGTSWSTDATVEAITLSGTRTEDDGTLSDSAIAADASLFVDLDATPEDVSYYTITFTYYVNPGD